MLLHTMGTALAAVVLALDALGLIYLVPGGPCRHRHAACAAMRLARADRQNARSLFMASNFYLMIVVVVICVNMRSRSICRGFASKDANGSPANRHLRRPCVERTTMDENGTARSAPGRLRADRPKASIFKSAARTGCADTPLLRPVSDRAASMNRHVRDA